MKKHFTCIECNETLLISIIDYHLNPEFCPVCGVENSLKEIEPKLKINQNFDLVFGGERILSGSSSDNEKFQFLIKYWNKNEYNSPSYNSMCKIYYDEKFKRMYRKYRGIAKIRRSRNEIK